jgi:hypothetical protein
VAVCYLPLWPGGVGVAARGVCARPGGVHAADP